MTCIVTMISDRNKCGLQFFSVKLKRCFKIGRILIGRQCFIVVDSAERFVKLYGYNYETVHPKMKLLLLFIHPNLYEFLSSVEHKSRYFEVE